MPGPISHAAGPPWGDGTWAGWDPDARPRRVSRPLRLWIPVVLSALVQLPTAVWIVRVDQPEPLVAALTIALAVVGPAALVAARRLPGPVAAFVAVVTVVAVLASADGGTPPLAFAFALASAVVRGARAWAWASLAGAWAVALALAAFGAGDAWPPPRMIGTTFGLLLAVGAGELIRTRRDRMEAFRAAAARRRASAAEEERLRIARELHDVLAHSLSQINVQAGVGLHLAQTQPEKAAEALAAIKQASKTALDDVRSVLGVLRADGETAPRSPQPGLDGVAALVAATGVPGAEVVLVDEVNGPTPPIAVGAAAYRIVQEALTNVARHGVGVSRVEVRLTRDDDALRIRVADDGRVDSVEPGRGLLGMRERVEQLGGTFRLAHDDGFMIDARLPLKGGPR